MIPVGLQLYSLRELAAADLAGTLEKIRNMGYTGIEFAGLYGHSVEEVKTLMSRYDLIPVSAHVPYAELMADIPGMMIHHTASDPAQMMEAYFSPTI